MSHQSITYKNILRIAYPIIIGSVAQNIVIATDTAFLGRVGEAQLGAAGNGGLLYLIMILVGMGFAIGSQIIIGRRNGEEKFSEIGKILDNTILFLFLTAAVFFCFSLFFSEKLIRSLSSSDEIFNGISDYIHYRSFGIFFGLFNAGITSFFVGTTNTRIITFSNGIMAVVNVFLAYGMIFGNFGFTAMGIKGAAMASAFSEMTASAVLLIYMLGKIDIKKYNIFRFSNLHIGPMKEILRISAPVMVQQFVAFSAWLFFFSIIEHMGVRELAISHISRSVYSLMILPVFGFSSAASTLTSNLLGQKQPQFVVKMILRTILLSVATVLIFSPVMFLFPEQLLSIYSRDAGLIHEAVPVLYIITIAMFFFAVCFVTFFSVSGTGNTRVSLTIEIISVFIYLLFTYYVAVLSKMPLPVVWCAEFIYFAVMGILSFLYLRFGHWRNVEV